MLRKTCLYLSILVLMLVISIAAGCGSGDSESAAGTTSGQSTNGENVAVGSTTGAQAPNFTLPKVAGGDLTLSDLRGKAVIVDFWDTWCPPCRRALPHLQELSETYADDLVVVGVAFGREGEAKVRKYVQDNGLTFEMVILTKGSSILEDYGRITSIPTTFLIDADGVIREKWVGGAAKSSYEKAVKAAIADKTKVG